jgi:hypothetical protein
MNLEPYIENVQRQLVAAVASGGDEAHALAEQLAPALESAVRLSLQDALAAAADEITVELAPGSVELRLRGREPEFVVSPAAADAPAETEAPPPYVDPAEAKHGAMSRINLRMPEQLRLRVEVAAASAGLSVNAWLVRAVAAATDRGGAGSRGRGPVTGGQRFTGWAR